MKLKTFKALAIAGFSVFPATAVERLHVSVPFSFMVGGTKMSAGDYSITEGNNGMLTLTGAKTSAMVLTVPADYSKGNNTGLSFSSTSNNAVLTSVQVDGAFSRDIPSHTAK